MSGVVVYCCEVVVWDRPSEPNGVITSYELLFLGSELPIQRTHDDTTHFTIPALPNGGVGVFVRVSYSIMCMYTQYGVCMCACLCM